jgi:TonB-linked SusC/RagA family outer membrane protein
MKYLSLLWYYYVKNSRHKQIFRIMWFSTFLLFFCSILMFAENTYSQKARVTIKERNVSLETILDEIENQTDYLFVYNGNQVDVNKNVSINAKNEPVNELLSDLFSDSQVKYVMEGTHIVLLANGEEMSSVISQQTLTVTGIVSDNFGNPLPGVSITIKGTTSGVVTNANGKYSITVPSGESTLVFSFIGFVTQELTVNNQNIINVTLLEDIQQVEEVVVIGYGSVKKSDLTGSVAAISDSKFRDQPITRLDQALTGRAPGVMVLTNSGSPDQVTQIRIRGANSIYGGNDPLYIVDGVANSSLFNSLDANDIQSIEILKDASATAIYGSRGANGVVLVTTKRGAEGRTRVVFETNNTWSSLAKKYDMLSAADFAESVNEWRGNETFTQAQIDDFHAGRAGVDWQDLIFRTAYTQNHKLNLSGGTDKVRYFISGNYLDAQGILIESGVKRYGLRSNITADAAKWLKMDLNINAFSKKTTQNSNGQQGSIGSPISDALTYSPTISLKDENGNWNSDNICNLLQNPYGRLIQDKYDGATAYASANMKLTFLLPVKGLTFDLQGAAAYSSWSSFWLYSSKNNLRGQNSAGNNRNDGWDLYNLDQLNYTNHWGAHRLSAMIAAEFTQNTGGSLQASSSKLLTESVGYWNLGMGTADPISNSYWGSALASYFGRGMYSYKDRYMLTATIRRDGSSKFQGSNKWGNFPSFAFAWRASEEKFIQDMNLFDNLKIRASWGITGNQSINNYGTLGLLAGANSTWGGGNSDNKTGYIVGGPPAPNLSWEKTYQYDLGLDFGIFRNRLSATIDFYQKDTKDLLLQKPIPLYNGGGNMWENLGQVRNKGIDFSLDGIILKNNDFQWESVFNFSYNQNKVIDLGGQESMMTGSQIANGMSINTAILKVGQPMGSIQGYTWLGLWRTDQADEAAKWGQKPGDNHFKDFDGNYKLNSEDISIIGHAFPDKFVGWNNIFSWKRLDVNIIFQGAFGADRLNLGRYLMNEPNSDVKWMTGSEGWFNRWTPENQDTWVPNPFSTSVIPHSESQQYLEKADYVRLKNISISYTFPKSMIKLGDITLTLSAQNLFTFTGYKGGDPEATMSSFGSLPGTVTGNKDTNAGIDAISYPQPRSFTLGARLSF